MNDLLPPFRKRAYYASPPGAAQTTTTMKVTKHYEQNHVILYVTEGDLQTTITLDSDRQMKRLADCLSDLYRTDGREVTITPSK